jgi:hypothetical protein
VTTRGKAPRCCVLCKRMFAGWPGAPKACTHCWMSLPPEEWEKWYAMANSNGPIRANRWLSRL